MKQYLLLLVFLLTMSSILFTQSAYLSVNAPHTGGWGSGTIEEATYYINPQGSYCQHDLYLTFSSRGAFFLPSDSLEVTLDFSLPSGSFVSDLWLWIDEVPVKALIVDRARARATYENIVRRIRRDPAILEKVYDDYYSLKIYPLLVGGVRTIKLSYYSLYNSAANDSLSVPLPVWIVNSSYNTLDSLTVLTQKNNWRGKPRIVENSAAHFVERNDSTYGTIYAAKLSGDAVKSLGAISVGFADTFSSRPIYIEKFGTADSGSYNLRVLPHQNLGLPMNRKILFLIDHDSLRSYYSKQDFYHIVTKTIMAKLNPSDSFNVILSSKKGMIYSSASWMSADSNSIRLAFSKVPLMDILDKSDLGNLLFTGIDFIYSHGKENTSIMVLASSHEYNSLTKSNSYYDSLSKRFEFDVPIYFLSYGYSWDSGFWAAGTYYQGNYYLYRLIALNSKGSYWQYYYDVDYMVESAIEEIRGFVEYFDLITYLQNGFTYEKINSTELTRIPVYDYYTQFGKYSGEFPFIIQMSAKYRGKMYHETFTVADSATIQSDSSLNVYGANQQIVQLRGNGSQFAKDRIVELSTQYRILTEYTAFLALEPGQKLCDTCLGTNNPVVTYIAEENILPQTYKVIQAYPNPFNPETRLKIRLPQGVQNDGVKLQIFNILGQLVKTFDIGNLTDKNYSEIVWNATSNEGARVSSGVYFAVLTTPQKRHAVKLMLLK